MLRTCALHTTPQPGNAIPRLVLTGPKTLGAFVVAYALSPIDLIPDFIPVLDYVDDVLLLPALIWLTVRLLPPAVLADSRQQAEAWMQAQGRKPRSRAGVALVVGVWLCVCVGAFLVFRGR